MLPFKVILFDLGNTLLYFDTDWPPILEEASIELTRSLVANGLRLSEKDFANDFLAIMQNNNSRREQDYAEVTFDSVLRKLLASKGFGSVNPNIVRPAIDAFFAITQQHWHIENDAISTLTSLQGLGCHFGMISNAGDPQDVYALVKTSGLRPFFQKVWISSEIGFRKPHPRMYELALDYFQIRPKDAVMVGDTLNADILGANNMGIATIWITRRANTPENRADKLRILPDQNIKTLGELPSLLMNW